MKSIKIFPLLFAALSLLTFISSEAQVKITDGASLTMDANSLLELESPNKGLLIPRISINNLILPAPLTAPVPEGMVVYSSGGTVANGFYYWSGTSWIPFATGSGSQWTTNGSDIYYNSGKVGIGALVPAEPLDINGNIKIGDATTGTIRATKELVLRQDGDVYGPTILRLRNRNTENGAIFETTDPTYPLVDFIFRNNLNQRNIRFESRAAFARTGTPSFHLGGASPDNPTLSLGDNYAAFNKNVRIGDYTSPLTALDVNGKITLRTGASAGAVLVSDANGTGTWTSPGSVHNVPVAKSVSATLLKTETVVLASGDITLTLPVVTPADNGLSITVKNTGTHLNLVIISGNSGATIDGKTSLNLTRWQGNTYIAWNGNWITESKETETENFFEVSAVSSFTTIAEVIAFLNIHMSGPSVVSIGAGEHEITATQTVNLPYPVTFQGISFGETTIKAAVSGNGLFNCLSECYFKMLIFEATSNAPGNDGIHFTGSEVYYEVKDAYFTGFNKGIVTTTNTDLWIFEVDIEDCTTGLEINAGTASGGQMRISETDFLQCATGISLLSGVSEVISIMNCTFYNLESGTDIGIHYHPDSFTSFKNMMIANNGWNNEGTFISGFDFSRPDGRDADALLVGNAGTEDVKPHCKINVTNNALVTSIPVSGTYHKAMWVNSSVLQSKWNIADNKMTYLSTNASDGWAIITGSLSSSSTNRVITIAIVKNGTTGTRYGETSLRVTTANQPFQFSTVVYVPGLSKNDFLELFVTSNISVNVTFQDVYWFTNTQ